MKKKLVTVVLCLAMAASTLIGCGNEAVSNTSETKTENKAESVKTSESAVAEKPVEMTEITYNCTDNPAVKEYWLGKIEEFNNTIGQEKGIKIVMTEHNGDALKAGLESGSAPDLFGISNVASYAENGWIVALNEYKEFDELLEKNNILVEGTTTGNLYQGNVYRIIWGAQTYGLAYNKDMFKAAGLVDENGEAKPPKTFDELREYAKILTNTEKQQYGIIYPGKWSAWYAYEVEMLVLGGTGRYGYDFVNGVYDYSNYKPALECILGMDDDGSVYPGVDGMDNDPARARFAEGNIGMKFCVSWDSAVWNEQFPAKCDWGVAKIPSVSEDVEYKNPIVYSYFVGINAKSVEEKGIEKLAIVYNYLASDEIQKERYANGLQLPARLDIAESVELDESIKGWADFAQLVDNAAVFPRSLPTDMSGKPSNKETYLNQIWPRTITLDEWVAERNKTVAEAAKAYQAAHPEIDYKAYIYPDFDNTIK